MKPKNSRAPEAFRRLATLSRDAHTRCNVRAPCTAENNEANRCSTSTENHLVATGGSASSTLVYDVLGRLAQISVGGTTTQFHYDGDALVGEYVSGAMQRRYVHGDQVDEPLVQYTGTDVSPGSRRYLHADHQGSVIAHSDNAGSLLAQTSTIHMACPAPQTPTGSATPGRPGSRS